MRIKHPRRTDCGAVASTSQTVIRTSEYSFDVASIIVVQDTFDRGLAVLSVVPFDKRYGG